MNVENMKKLIQVLEDGSLQFREQPVHFKMDTWVLENECGTYACIAGHAAILASEERGYFDHTELKIRADAVASKWLEIDDQTAEKLFLSFPDDASLFYDPIYGAERCKKFLAEHLLKEQSV